MFKMLPEISRKIRKLLWQPNLGQNCTNFNSLQEIEDFFACTVRYAELLNSNMLLEFSS